MAQPTRTVLITGASSGIGRAAVELFARRGWSVAATARDPAALRDFESVGPVAGFRLDVTDEATIQSAVAAAIDRFGRIDALVNNAGFAVMGPFEETDRAQVDRQFATNVFGLMATTRAILPHFRRQGSGTIVNLSSIAGRMGFPLLSLYHASKWAVEGFSESLRHEVAPFGIRVRLVEPGPIRTDFYGRSMDRTGEGIGERPASPYAAFARRVAARFDAEARKAPGPEVVARVILRACTARGGRFRYPANAAGLLLARKLLPDRIFFAGIRTVLTR